MSSQLQREIDQLTVAIDLLSERPRPISKKPQIARLKARRGELKLLRDTGVVIQPPLPPPAHWKSSVPHARTWSFRSRRTI